MVNNQEKSFTLIELLVVLALVAILSVVVILTLNPAELIKQARDSNRLSDLSTINTALNLFSADVTGGFMGTSTIVYVSIPDNASSTCGSLGLPTLPTGYTYKCATTANLRNTDGTGWIPVNFQRISSNSPVSQLPIDPINTTSTGNYYTYVTGGSWMLTAIPESQKQKTELSTNPHITYYPGTIGIGNNLNLSPLFNSTGLVGYWKFDEGSGAVAKDSSGNGNDGSLSSPAPAWSSGKIGAGSLSFNGTNNYVTSSVTNIPLGATARTITLWAQERGVSNYPRLFQYGTNGTNQQLSIYNHPGTNSWYVGTYGGNLFSGITPDTRWHMHTLSYDGTNLSYLIDGIATTINQFSISLNTGNSVFIIASDLEGDPFNGLIDDVRIYNRALSASEISALYNATK